MSRFELIYGSFIVYSPRGSSDVSRRSQRFVRNLKEDRYVTENETASAFLVRRLSEEIDKSALADFFSESIGLVPVPRSSLYSKGALWPAIVLANELARQGYGQVFDVLRRTEAVEKSAFSGTGERPLPQRHYETLEVKSQIGPQILCLVDDVVTKGATLTGAARRLQEVYGDRQIKAFAAVRTLGLQPEIEQIVSPWLGSILWDGTRVIRDP